MEQLWTSYDVWNIFIYEVFPFNCRTQFMIHWTVLLNLKFSKNGTRTNENEQESKIKIWTQSLDSKSLNLS